MSLFKFNVSFKNLKYSSNVLFLVVCIHSNIFTILLYFLLRFSWFKLNKYLLICFLVICFNIFSLFSSNFLSCFPSIKYFITLGIITNNIKYSSNVLFLVVCIHSNIFVKLLLFISKLPLFKDDIYSLILLLVIPFNIFSLFSSNILSCSLRAK